MKKEKKQLIPPKKVKIIYQADEVNSEFDETMEQLLVYCGLKLIRSGYNFNTRERNLGFESED